MHATTRTVALQGALAHLIDVQVDVSRGVIATALVGRPDASINEARDRCRSAVLNSGFEWPVTRRITILLSPADLPKRGPHFDLSIALGVVAAATENFPRDRLAGTAFIGELTLDGRLRCVPGVLAMSMAAVGQGLTRLVVPEPQAQEASMVPGAEVLGVRSLAQVVALVTGTEVPDAPPVEPPTGNPLLSWRGEDRHEQVDLADVRGMADPRFALEVAAVGGHHLMLSGPRGAGKTTLAERLPTILPDLDPEEALELTAILSLTGAGLPPGTGLARRPPYRAPHHSASRAGVLGGGTGRVHPGDVSRAHLGVLLLDEFPLFPTDVLEALREPLENGEITISRGEETAQFPARSLVVMACNPCPCGDFHPGRRDHGCTCSEVRRRDYRARVSGPIVDRIDITRHVEPLRPHERADPLDRIDTSEVVRTRVTRARVRQADRYESRGWRLNAHVPGPALRDEWPLSDAATRRLDDELVAGRLTQRGTVRVHRLAWSVADLWGSGGPGTTELDVALRLRRGEPMDLAVLDRPRGDVVGLA